MYIHIYIYIHINIYTHIYIYIYSIVAISGGRRPLICRVANPPETRSGADP